MDSARNTPRGGRLFGGLTPSHSSTSASPYSPVRRAAPSQTPGRKLFQQSTTRPPSNLSHVVTAEPTTPRGPLRDDATPKGRSTYGFSPELHPSTMKKSFPSSNTPARARGAMTPQVNGRGMAKASASTNEPFQMRIPSPSAELTGEVLAKKVPEDPNRIGSVYADEYLADLVPPEFDDLQRRQFFCILDLRRLKYAADEVFVKKDWKLNIMNFAKEYEKSRSLIMLRYGLYEFKTVRPSAEVMRSWRASHGLPEPDEEQPQTNGTKAPIFTQSSKRKAEEELTKDTALATSSPNKTKRRAVDQEPVEDRPIHPLPSKKKRSLEDEEQNENTPTKVQRKAAPSATRSVFEAVADNAQGITSAPTVSVTPAKPATDSRPTAKPAAKATVGARSVLEGFKPGTNGQNLATSNNIFGYLSDAGSANGSINADADGESESESEEEEAGQAGAAQSYEPSVAASGGADTPSSTIGQSLFPPPTSGLATGPSSTSSEARETTPSRSLFDRVTKGADGQPVRAVSADATRKSQAISESVAEKPSLFGNGKPKVPSDQTYKPDTPLKFAPAAGTSLFGTAQAKPPVSNPFAPKDTSGAPSLFGGPKAETTKEPSATSQPQPSTGGEDKSQASALDGPPTKRPAFGAASKPSTTAPTTAAPTPASTLFGSAPKAETAPSTTAPPSLFGTTTKPAESAPSTFKPSTSTPSLFADLNKPAPETPKPAAETTPNVSTSTAPSLFGTTAKTDAGTSNIFAKSGTSTPSIFGAGEQKPASSLFGGDLKPATSEAKPAPSLFGGATTGAVTESKPAFPPSTPGPAAPPIFGGSPMKVEPSKPAGGSIFGGTAPAAAPAPIFNFGGAKTSAPSTTGSIFGASSAVPSQPTPPAPIQFGSGSSASFTFSAGSVPNNPFASAGSSQPSGSASAPSSFTFGAGGGGSSSTPGTFSFTAGGSGSSAPAPSASGAPFVFGAGSSQPQAPTTSAGSSGIFGGQATSAPSISFTGAAPPANNIFGNKPAAATPSIFGGLAPNLGGASTGTSSPFNFGGASSLATTPATGTPEPGATQDQEGGAGGHADDDEAPEEQIVLTKGGPGEEQEEVVHEVRAKVLKFVPPGNDSDSEGKSPGGGGGAKKEKSPWSLKGVGPLRVLKHKETGTVRILLRTEPGGNVALNRALLPSVDYKLQGPKYVHLMTADDKGTGLETWMVQVKTKEIAEELVAVLQREKVHNKK